MGLLVDGVWQQDGRRTKDGHFIRPAPRFRNWVTPDGSAGPSGEGGFKAASRPLSPLRLARLPLGAPHRHLPQAQGAGERHLDVGGLARHAQGRLDLRQGRGLDRRRRQRQEQAVARSICSPTRNIPAASACRCCGTRSARRSSTTSRPKSSACSIRRSTPSPTCTPIIIRQALRAEIDRHQRPGLSEHQQRRLSRRLRHHAGGLRAGVPQRVRRARRDRADPCRSSAISPASTITEADWRLFCTLIRFDAVYYAHFKCNWRHIYEYPNLSNYVRDLYQEPGVAETVSLAQIKRHYYGSQRQVNPTGIVPVGPQLDFAAPHDRGAVRRGAATPQCSALTTFWPSSRSPDLVVRALHHDADEAERLELGERRESRWRAPSASRRSAGLRSWRSSRSRRARRHAPAPCA